MQFFSEFETSVGLKTILPAELERSLGNTKDQHGVQLKEMSSFKKK